jgi:hypothetical protein
MILVLVLGWLTPGPIARAGEKGEEGAAPGEDARTALAARLTRTVTELRRTREGRYRREKRHASEVRTLKDRVAELEARKGSLKAQTAALKKKSGEEEGKIASLRKEAEVIRSRLKRAGDALRAAAIRLRDVEPLPDRLRSVNTVLEYEIALGSTSEAYRSRVSLGENRIPRARCFRLGMVALAFITEDGDATGILVEKEKGEFGWKTDLGFWDRWGVKRALEILEKRRPPVFTRFPMDLGRVKKSGGAPAEGAPKKGKDGS